MVKSNNPLDLQLITFNVNFYSKNVHYLHSWFVYLALVDLCICRTHKYTNKQTKINLFNLLHFSGPSPFISKQFLQKLKLELNFKDEKIASLVREIDELQAGMMSSINN